MKRIFPAVLALLLLVGCGKTSDNSADKNPIISQDSSQTLQTESAAVTTVSSETTAEQTALAQTTADTAATTVPTTTAEATTVTTTEATTVTTTAATTVTTTKATTVTTTAATTVATTKATTVTTTAATTVATTKATTVTTTAATTVAETAAPASKDEDLMDNVKTETSVPSSAYDRRSGVTYPTAEHKTYHSNTTGRDRGVNILLPANYDSSKKYPVLYMLHGIFCDEYTLLRDSDMNIACIYTNLVKDGLAKDMIIVFPNMYASSDPNMAPSFDDISSVIPYDNFINDLVNDLMPYIEKNYSVLTGRDNTAIAGFSMGGREALFIGFERPDLFAYCGAIAPAPGLTPMRDWAFDHPGQYKESELTFEGKEYSPKLLIICGGTKDGTVGDTYKKYDEIMTRNGVKHICYDIPDAGHEGSVKTGFYNFIRYIF